MSYYYETFLQVLFIPDFDGNGPLKRGRAIGRGIGPCKDNNASSGCGRQKRPLSEEEKTND